MAKADLTREVVNEALGDIPPRLRMVLALRFGLIDDRPRTLEEAGRELGVTRERVRQLEKQALTQLRGSSRLEKEEELSRVRQMILAARRTTANRR